MCRLLLLLFSSFLLSISSIEAAKILVFNPKFGVSHVSFTGKIADTLAAAGHEIVVYQPSMNENITMTGSKHKSIRYYSKPRDFSVNPDYTFDMLQSQLWGQDSFAKMRSQSALLYSVKHDFCVEILNDKENLEKLKKESFDLGLSEIFESCGFGVFQAIGLTRYISTTGGTYTAGQMDYQGIPIPFSYTPGILSSNTDQMTFLERFKNMFSLALEVQVLGQKFLAGPEDAIRQVLDPEFSMNQAIKDSVFLFINTDEVVDYTLPATPKAVFIGGMGKVQSKPLEKKYAEIMDNSKKGVVLFSFGSVVQSSSMPSDMKQAFLEAFAEFPDVTFLWKYEVDDDVGSGHKNVIKEKWMPQPDILDHPKLLAFISHGGMNSVLEGATKGVPMICVPVFADQTHNAQLLHRRGTSVTLDKLELTKDKIVAALREVISNPKYRENAQLLSRMVRAKPLSADERIVKFAEFAAAFGHARPFTTSGVSMSFVQLYSLDVLAAYLMLFGLFLIIAAGAVVLLYKCVKRRLSRSKESGRDGHLKNKKSQ